MSVFATEQDVYDQIGRLLEAVVYDERLVWQFQRADTVVQYRYHDPDAVMTVDVRRDSDYRAQLGAYEHSQLVAA